MHKVAPLAKHIAFEPIPVLYNQLYKKYNHIAHVFEVALSNKKAYQLLIVCLPIWLIVACLKYL
jgi:hypothetical protein